MTQVQKSAQSGTSGQHSKKGEINPLVAGVAGAVVGAGVGALGAMAMRDDKIRAKAHEIGRTIGEKAQEYAKNMKEEAKSQFQVKGGEATKEVKKVVSGGNNKSAK